MLATRRYKTAIPVVVVVAVLIVGFLAIRSRGDDNKAVETLDRDTNCAPVARADVAATRPGEVVKVDVLANDTDPEGAALDFQILKATGGQAVTDNADTPTDAADDTVAFTPDDPAVAESVVTYQALDPEGGFGSGTLTIYVNPEAAPPAGVTSAVVDNAQTEGCGEPVDVTTTTSDAFGPIGPDVSGVDETTTSLDDDTGSTDSTTRNRTSTTKKSTGKTTTTLKKTTTTAKAPNPTSPPPTDPPATTTTKKPTPSSTTPPPQYPECEAYNPRSQQYKDCLKARASGKPYPPVTTTTPAP